MGLPPCWDFFKSGHIHVNAAGMGDRWYDATGWCCYTSKGQTAGDLLADCLYFAAEQHLKGHRIRKDYSDGDPDLESDFYLLKHTACAAVLTENGYQDCVRSLEYLESEEGRRAIVALHVEGIINYVQSLNSPKVTLTHASTMTSSGRLSGHSSTTTARGSAGILVSSRD